MKFTELGRIPDFRIHMKFRDQIWRFKVLHAERYDLREQYNQIDRKDGGCGAWIVL